MVCCKWNRDRVLLECGFQAKEVSGSGLPFCASRTEQQASLLEGHHFPLAQHDSAKLSRYSWVDMEALARSFHCDLEAKTRLLTLLIAVTSSQSRQNCKVD